MQTSPWHPSAIVTASIEVFHRFLKIFHSLTRSCLHYIFCNNRPKPIFPRVTEMPKELAVLEPLHWQYWIGLSGKQLLMFVTYGTDTVILKMSHISQLLHPLLIHPPNLFPITQVFIISYIHTYTCKLFCSYELTCMKCLQSPLKNWKHQHADKKKKNRMGNFFRQQHHFICIVIYLK